MTIIRTLQTELYKMHQDALNPTGFVDRTATLSFDDGSRKLTITGDHEFYINGVKFSKTTDDIIIGTSEGFHYVYYDNTGTLQTTATWGYDAFYNKVPVSFIYWNPTLGKGLLTEERHGCNKSIEWHTMHHFTVGCLYSQGFIGAFTDTTFSVGAGTYFDEDLRHDIGAQTTCNIMYKNGSNNFTWDETQTSVYKTVAGTIQYNNINALANVPVANYVAYFIFITNDINNPVYSIMGQRVDTTLANARENNSINNVSFGLWISIEAKLIYRVLYRNVGGTPTYIESEFLALATQYPSSPYIATDHNTLSNLQMSGTGITYGHINDQTQIIAGNKTFSGNIKATQLMTGGVSADSSIGSLGVLGTASDIASTGFFLTTTEDYFPQVHIVPWAHDDIRLQLDCYFDGTNTKSSDAGSNFILTKSNDAFKLLFKTGVNAGDTITGMWGELINLKVTDSYTPLQIYSPTHDNVNIYFDSYFDGANHKSSDVGSNFLLRKNNDDLTFYYDAGIAQGSTITWVNGLSLHNDGRVYINGINGQSRTLQIAYGTDASLSTDGFMVLGVTTAKNIVIDNNEIIARNNGSNSTLYLQATGGVFNCQGIYDNTTTSSSNVNIDSGGLVRRSTCGEFWKGNIRPLEIDTAGIYNLTIGTFEEKNTGETGHSIIGDVNSYNALPAAVIKAKFKLDENDNVLPNQRQYSDEEKTEVYDSLNWNLIVTALLVELKKLNDRVEILEETLEM